MRRLSWLAIIILLPNMVQAQCLDKGYTVVFVNGIFNTKIESLESAKTLKDKLPQNLGGEPIIVTLGYNPSHIAGLGDLAQAAIQGFAGSISTFDRDTILMQIHPEVTTRKLLFVGHSQGTFYTNDMYGYLLSHGEPKNSVGVYNVATPANYVAGGGKYFTSSSDSIVGLFVEYAKSSGALMPLPANGDLDFGGAVGNGHNFVNNYLAYGSERIVTDIQSGLARLEVEKGEREDGCFIPPNDDLSYKAKEAFFAIADPAAVGIKVVAIAGAKSTAYAFDGIKNGLAAAGSFFISAADIATPKPRTDNLPGSFDVVRSLYGAGATEKDLNDLLGKKQSSAVALAISSPPAVIPKNSSGEVKGASTENVAPLIPPTSLFPGGSPGFGGGGSVPATTETNLPATTVPPDPPDPVVPDGVPPTLLSVISQQHTFAANYSSIVVTPMATSGTSWAIRILFDEDISSAPRVIDTPPGGDPAYTTVQSVTNCGDADLKTFCFSFTPTQDIESRSDNNQPQDWNFEIAGATDLSGEIMASTTYGFLIDTHAPSVSPTHGSLVRNSTLPVVDGLIDHDNERVNVLVNGYFFVTQAIANYWFGSLVTGQELSEGVYEVEASSTDRFGNLGPSAHWQIFIDLTPPVITLTPDITTPDIDVSIMRSVVYSVTDNNGGITATCTIDHFSSNVCVGLDLWALDPGPHTLSIVATDTAGNQAMLSRSFNVLP